MIVLLVGHYLMKIPYDDLVGVASGATGNPAILVYSTRMAPTERPDIGYAMIFPSMTIVKVIAVQIVGLLPATGARIVDGRVRFAATPETVGGRSPVLTPQIVTIDAILPATMAVRAEESGIKRAATDLLTLLVLSLLAGAFISFGAIFATTVGAGSIAVATVDGATTASAALPYGVVRLLIGLVFSVGLLLVIVGGAELFTGNNMIVMAWASRKVTTGALLLNWVVAFIGNFIGAVATAVLMFFTTQYTFGGGSVGLVALNTAQRRLARLRSGADARHHVQCAGLPGRLDVLRRPHHDRPGRHDRSADRRLRGGRFRAQHCELYFIPIGLFIKASAPELLLGRDRQDGRRITRP